MRKLAEAAPALEEGQARGGPHAHTQVVRETVGAGSAVPVEPNVMLHLGLRGPHHPVGGKGERGLGQVVARGVARRKHSAVEHGERDLVGVV